MNRKFLQILETYSFLILITLIFYTIGESIIYYFTKNEDYVYYFQLMLTTYIKMQAIYMVTPFYYRGIDKVRYRKVAIPFAILFIGVNLLGNNIKGNLLIQLIVSALVVLTHMASYVYSIRRYSFKNSVRASIFIVKKQFIYLLVVYIFIAIGILAFTPVAFVTGSLIKLLTPLSLTNSYTISLVGIFSVFLETIFLGVMYYEKFENILNVK